jgi:hypothetical protein
MEGSGSVQVITNPSQGGTKTNGFYGSGTAVLLQYFYGRKL